MFQYELNNFISVKQSQQQKNFLRWRILQHYERNEHNQLGQKIDFHRNEFNNSSFSRKPSSWIHREIQMYIAFYLSRRIVNQLAISNLIPGKAQHMNRVDKKIFFICSCALISIHHTQAIEIECISFDIRGISKKIANHSQIFEEKKKLISNILWIYCS